MPVPLPRRPLPTRRRWTVLIATLSAAVLLGGADRVFAAVAAGRLAERLQCVAGTDRRPDVTVHGFPFLAQALSGRYRGLDVTVRDLRHGRLHLASVHASLRDAALNGSSMSIGAARIEAVLPFTALPARIGDRTVSYAASDGLLAVTTAVTLVGRSLPVTLLGQPEITDGTLRIEPREVEVLGVRRPAEQLLDRIGLRERPSQALPELPAGLRYASVGVRPDGMMITVTGAGLSVPPAGHQVPATEPCGAQR